MDEHNKRSTDPTGIEPGTSKVQDKHPPSTNRGTMTWRPPTPQNTTYTTNTNTTARHNFEWATFILFFSY